MLRLFFVFLLSIMMLATPTFGQGAASTAKPGSSTIKGVLVQVSKLPPAETNSYADCYYTATMEIDQIDSGESIEKRVVLVLPGFFSRKYAPEAKFKIGDKVRATVVPFATMPENIRQIQQADEVEAVDLDFYFPQHIALIPQLTKATSSVSFARAKQVEEVITSQTTDLKARAARQESMRHDLEQINQLLAAHGGDWDKWYDSLKSFRAQYQKQFDAKAQRWVGDSFFSAGYVDNGKIYSPEFIRSIINFKKYLSARNIDLILVRVPNKGEIVDDLFAPSPEKQITNPYLLRMYKELLEADVEIITNIIPTAKMERLKYPLMYWYQDFSEVHPAEGISWVVADELAKRVSRYNSIRSTSPLALNLKDVPRAVQDLRWPAGNPKFNPSEYVRFSAVMDRTDKPLRLRQEINSPVLMIGSSFIAAPALGKGGSIPHYFAYRTGIVPDIVQRNEGDLMMPRVVAREGDSFLRNRSVCLFPFVPSTAYNALASLPIFDPEKSTKTLLASYTGPKMREAITFPSETVEGVLSLSPDGILQSRPSKARGEKGTVRVQVPDAVSDFPNFVVEVEFSSKDRTRVTAKYSGQQDSLMRSETQANGEEAFAFVTTSNRSVDLVFEGSYWYKVPTVIRSIKFFGVRQPKHYSSLL